MSHPIKKEKAATAANAKSGFLGAEIKCPEISETTCEPIVTPEYFKPILGNHLGAGYRAFDENASTIKSALRTRYEVTSFVTR